MKRTKSAGTIALLLACLLALSLFAPAALAAEEAEGPLVITLPEDAAIASGKAFESYVITWEPLETEVFRYAVIGLNSVQGYTQAIGGGGAMMGYVADGEGTEYLVNMAPYDAIEIPGDATEYDFAELMNAYCAMTKKELTGSDGCYLMVMVVPQAGEPVFQNIDLPVDLGV